MRTAPKVIPTQPQCTYVIHYAGNRWLYQSFYHYLNNLAGRTADETVYQCECLLDAVAASRPGTKMIRKPKFSLRVNVLETLTEGFRNVGDRHNGVRIALAHDRFEGVELSTANDHHDHRLLDARIHTGRL